MKTKEYLSAQEQAECGPFSLPWWVSYPLVIPGSARHTPGRKFQKQDMAIGNEWPIGQFLRCGSNEVLKLWGAPTNEQIVAEMPLTCHERIRSQLNEWTNESMNQWTKWISQSMKQRTNEATKQWPKESSNQWFDEMNQWISEWMNEWTNEWMNERTNE